MQQSLLLQHHHGLNGSRPPQAMLSRDSQLPRGTRRVKSLVLGL